LLLVKILDRYIMIRVLVNFFILFLLLYLFAATIDVILNLEQFDEVARERLPDDAGLLRRLVMALLLAFNFHGPQFFQFYAYLHGLVAIGAVGFTLSQMSRNRELVAMLAAGRSLLRASAPILWLIFAFGLLQVVNQEIVLPRLAPLLLRGHDQIGMEGTSAFPVPFTIDSQGRLLQSPGFDPIEKTLETPSIIVRDGKGRTVERIRAASAVWNEDQQSWLLEDGVVVRISHGGEDATLASRPVPIDRYETELSPELLTVRRFGQYTGMLSTWQITQLLDSPDVQEADTLRRSRYSRWASILVNILVMLIALPFFMHREPINLLSRSLMCALFVVPLYLFVATFMLVPLPGISPALGAFLPVIVLLPISLARFGWIRT
tara:strand:- start:2848 stop:3981 length:1134 start_codon:yes stop_codon:yes gene_type:complete